VGRGKERDNNSPAKNRNNIVHDQAGIMWGWSVHAE